MKPTAPSAVASPSTSRPDADGPSPSRATPIRCVPRYPAQMPARIATPPIDGVPRLVLWLGGPSSRISWPKPCRVNSRISTGVSRIDTASDMPTAIRISLIGAVPFASAIRACANAARPAELEALTSTTSPGRNSARSSASAASASSTRMASAPHDPSMTAP